MTKTKNMRKSIYFFALVILLGGAYFISQRTTQSLSIVGWEVSQECENKVTCTGSNCCKQFVGDRAEYVVAQWFCEEPAYLNKLDNYCDACYGMYPNKTQPWSCTYEQESICKAQNQMSAWLTDGYTECDVTDKYDNVKYDSKADQFNVFKQCMTARCKGCPMDKVAIPQYEVWYDNYEYTNPHTILSSWSCEGKQCQVGDSQTRSCGDNSMVISQVCNEYFQWENVTEPCCTTEDKVAYCPDDTVEYRCYQGDWVKINDCISAPNPTPNNETGASPNQSTINQSLTVPSENSQGVIESGIDGILTVLVGKTTADQVLNVSSADGETDDISKPSDITGNPNLLGMLVVLFVMILAVLSYLYVTRQT